jgi:hypothetical protein
VIQTRRLLDDARPQAKPIDGYVEGHRLAAIARSLDGQGNGSQGSDRSRPANIFPDS